MAVDNDTYAQLSIIIPVHVKTDSLSNLELSLKKTLGLSIQLILVSDNNEKEIQENLLKLANTYHAKVVQVDVRSPGRARNEGLKLAKTPWIAFWDSDDVGEPEPVLKAIKEAPENSKVIIGNYRVQNIGNLSNSKESNHKNLNKIMINPGIWRFVFASEIVKENRFPDYRMGEDQVFLARLNIKRESIHFVDQVFYTYFIGTASQLTANPDARGEALAAYFELDLLARNCSKVNFSTLILKTRLLFTAFKYKKLDVFWFIKELLLLRAYDTRLRLRTYIAEMYTLYLVWRIR